MKTKLKLRKFPVLLVLLLLLGTLSGNSNPLYARHGSSPGGKEKEVVAGAAAIAVADTGIVSGIDIRGLVEDTRGTPVQSAAVELKYGNAVSGATKVSHALTDSNGVFVFNNIEGRGPFIFTITHTSIVTKTLRKDRFDTSKKQSLYIVVDDKVKSLNDIVVVGYGQVKREDMTGSVATVDTNDLKNTSVMSADLALQGKVAGVDIMATSGEPGAAGSIRIRGTRSITATNEPLIVVDGVYDAVSSLTDINMADIASMSVLKDASATAIYGSRGSNGGNSSHDQAGQKG